MTRGKFLYSSWSLSSNWRGGGEELGAGRAEAGWTPAAQALAQLSGRDRALGGSGVLGEQAVNGLPGWMVLGPVSA